jgi:hypothetical protein
MARSIIPSPWPVVLIPRSIDEADLDVDTGNPLLEHGIPTTRWVFSLTQFGRRGSSRAIISAEYLDRVETEIHLGTAEPNLFRPMDDVIIWPELDALGNWVEGTGYAYFVDGRPADQTRSAWPRYTRIFGGLVKLKRVT